MRTVEKLTGKERMFVECYLENGYNAQNAARIAYPNAKEGTLRAMASRVRNRAHVDAYIEKRMAEKLKERNITKNRFTELLAEIATNPEKRDADRLQAIRLLQTQAGWESAKEFNINNGTITVNLIDEDDEDAVEPEQENI